MTEHPPALSIRNVRKSFGAYVAVEDVSFEVPRNEFFAILGPSGCGKTTLLRMIAGFEQPDRGELLISGESVLGVPPNQRPANMVFQSYAVFPHMSVWENIAYGLHVTGVSRGEVRERVAEAIRMVKLEGYERSKAHQLSGGQRQRAALARALVKRPRVLLLDEPLSALDAKLREAMQLEIVHLQQSTGVTFVLVTHDQNEALSMADRVAVMNAGRVEQLASPQELYERPVNRFVADFIGTINLFTGEVQDGGRRVRLAELDGASVPAEGLRADRVTVAVRPEKVRLMTEQPGDGLIACRGTVAEMAYYGDYSRVFVTTPSGARLTALVLNNDTHAPQNLKAGREIWCAWPGQDTLVLDD
jgi:spermidine/putrescine transport system ATP-binding protein/putrescine transport system ATP-binding protein